MRLLEQVHLFFRVRGARATRTWILFLRASCFWQSFALVLMRQYTEAFGRIHTVST